MSGVQPHLTHTLVICTRNRPAELADCLRTVATQTSPPDLICVVDASDGSDSASAVTEFVATSGCKVEYVAAEPGLAAQRNIALERITTEIVHFVDDDVLLEPAYCQGILDAFSDPGADAPSGVGGLITNAEAPRRGSWVSRMLGLTDAQPGRVLPSGMATPATGIEGDIEVEWLSGCSMSFRRNAIGALRFDENLGGHVLADDVDFTYRLGRTGRLVVTSSARLVHLTSPTNRDELSVMIGRGWLLRHRFVTSGVGGLRRGAFWRAWIGECFLSTYAAVVSRDRRHLRTVRATVLAARDVRRKRGPALAKRQHVVVVAHEASRTGAPLVLLSELRALLLRDVRVTVVLRRGGPLLAELRHLAPVITVTPSWLQPARSAAYRAHFGEAFESAMVAVRRVVHHVGEVNLIYANTLTNAGVLRRLRQLTCPVVTRAHELPEPKLPIRWYDPGEAVRWSDHFLPVSRAVEQGLQHEYGVPAERITVIHPGVGSLSPLPTESAPDFRARIGVPADALLVGACGTPIWAKGPDIFAATVDLVPDRIGGREVHFAWLGGQGHTQKRSPLAHAADDHRVHLLSTIEDTRPYYAALDVFFLSSRRDSFPLVVLEAARAAIPTVCARSSGGAAEFVAPGGGLVVNEAVPEQFAKALTQLLHDAALRTRCGTTARATCLAGYDAAHSAQDVANTLATFFADAPKT